MKNIREDKGYTYGIYSGIHSHRKGGYFFVQGDVGNEYVEPAIEETKKEMNFELSNTEREYLGLDKVKPNWEKVILKGDTYREPSILYFPCSVLNLHINHSSPT